MIELCNLSVGYKPAKTLISGINARIKPGRLVALLGRNGSGKSTLLRVIAGIDRPLGGEILIDGRDLGAIRPQDRARLIACVTTNRVRVANMLCRDIVAMGRAPWTDWIGRLSRRDMEFVDRALALTGMSAYASRPIDTLSDGEVQRVMIARALAQDTPVIVLDEPTSFLDIPNRYELCLLLASLAHDQAKTVVFSTHELDLALTFADEIALVQSSLGQLSVVPAASATDLLATEFPRIGAIGHSRL